MRINILCVDLDDTISDYPGWEGEGYKIVNGKPMTGVQETIDTLRNEGWLVLVYSTRCNFKGGVVATAKFLEDNGIRVDGVCFNKPPADIYLDDKGMTFDGNWSGMLEKIRSFKTWKKLQEIECQNSQKQLTELPQASKPSSPVSGKG